MRVATAITIILDNYATHRHEKVLNWIERKKRIFLHFTPAGASWANIVERFFASLTEKRIRRGVFTSVPHLETWWTKSVAGVMDEVSRGRAVPAETS